MSLACLHIQNIKVTKSEQHNLREIFVPYANPQLKQFNEHWATDSIAERRAQIQERYLRHVGQKQQSRAQPIKEGVVLIKNGTTMEDLHRLNKAMERELGIRAFRIDIHRDEGHHDNNKRWKPNLHAHLSLDMTHKKTGISLKLNKENMITLQDIVARELRMERGKSHALTGRKHIDPITFKIMKERERINLLKIETKFYEKLCAEAKEIIEKNGIDITMTLEQCLQKSSSFAEYKSLLADQDIEVKEVKNNKNETQLVYDASKVKTTNAEKILFESALPLKYRYQGLSHFEALKKGKKTRSAFNQKMFVSAKIKTCKEESNNFNEFLKATKAAGIEIVPQYNKDKIIGYTATAPEFANAVTFNHRELRKECHAYFLIKSFDTKNAPDKPKIKRYSVPQQAVILKRLMVKAAKEMKSVDHFFELLESNDVKIHKNLTAGRVTGYSIELDGIEDAKIFKASQIDRKLSIGKLKTKGKEKEVKGKEIAPSDKGLALEPPPKETPKESPKETIKAPDKQPDQATPKETVPVNLSVDDQKLAIEKICMQAKKESKSIDDFIRILSKSDVEIIGSKKDNKAVNYIGKLKNVKGPVMFGLSIFKDLNLEELIKETPKEAPKETIKTTADKESESARSQQVAILKSVMKQAAEEMSTVDHFFQILESNNVKVSKSVHSNNRIVGYSVQLNNIENPIKFDASDINFNLSIYGIQRIEKEKRNLSVHPLKDGGQKSGFVGQSKTVIPRHASDEKQISLMREICHRAKNKSNNIDEFIDELARENIIATPEVSGGKVVDYIVRFEKVSRYLPLVLSKLDASFSPDNFTKETIKTTPGKLLEGSRTSSRKDPGQTSGRLPDKLPGRAPAEQKAILKSVMKQAAEEMSTVDHFFQILESNNVKVSKSIHDDNTIAGYKVELIDIENPIKFYSSDINPNLSIYEIQRIEKEKRNLSVHPLKDGGQKSGFVGQSKTIIPRHASNEKQISLMREICHRAKNKSNNIDEFIDELARENIIATPKVSGGKVVDYIVRFEKVSRYLPLVLSKLDASFSPDNFTKGSPTQPDRTPAQEAAILKSVMKKAAEEMSTVDHFFEILESSGVKVSKSIPNDNTIAGYKVELKDIENPTKFYSSDINPNLSIYGIQKIEKEKKKQIIPFNATSKEQIRGIKSMCLEVRKKAGGIDEFLRILAKKDVKLTRIMKGGKIIDYVARSSKAENPIPVRLSTIKDLGLETLPKEAPKETAKTTDKLPDRTPAQQRIILKRLIAKAAKESVSVRRFFGVLEAGNVKVHKNLTAGKVTGYSVELNNVSHPITFKSSEVDRSLTLFNVEKLFQAKADKKELIGKLEDTFSRARDLNHLDKILGSRGVKLYPVKINNKVIHYTLVYKNKSFTSRELPPKYQSHNLNDHFKLQDIINSPFGKQQTVSYKDQKQVLFLGIKSALWNSRNIDNFAKRLSGLNIGIQLRGDDYTLINRNNAQPISISISISDIDKKFNPKTIHFILQNKSKDGAYQSSERQIDHLKNVCFEKVEKSTNIDEFVKNLEAANIKVTPKKEGGKVVNYELWQTDLVNPLPFALKEIDQSLDLDNLKILLDKNSKNQVSASDQRTLLEKAIIDSITLSTSVDFKSFFADLQKQGFETTPISRDGKLVDFEIRNNNLANPVKIKASQVREEFSVGNFLEVFESREESKGQAFEPQTGNAPSLANSLMGLIGSALLQSGGDGGEPTGQRQGKGKKKKQEEEEKRGRGFEM